MLTNWPDFLKEFTSTLKTSEYPGTRPATETQIAAVEKRLKVELPPSFRSFLLATNGWQRASREVPVIRGVDQVRWFNKEHPDWVQAYVGPAPRPGESPTFQQAYFDYSRANNLDFDTSHLRHTLCVSDVGDSAVLLLNPMVIWPDGEWEAWLFANWLPGAIRYHSFEDWMHSELAKLRDEAFERPFRSDERPTVFVDGPGKAKRRILPYEELPPLETLAKDLTSHRPGKREAAVQKLARVGGDRAIDLLLRTLQGDGDPRVRAESALALGRVRSPRTVETLIDATRDEDSTVASCAIHALGEFCDDRSAEYLLSILEGGFDSTAVGPLAKRRETRAIPVLIRKLKSKNLIDQHTGNIAGKLIAQFQDAGLHALEPLISHPEAEIRRRAVFGMADLAMVANQKPVKLRAQEILRQRLSTESDAQILKQIGIFLQVSDPKHI